MFTKNDLNNMLKASTEHSPNLDNNHMKLMNLINKSNLSSQERMETLFDDKLKRLINSSLMFGGSNHSNNNANNTMNDQAMSSLIDSKLIDFKEDIIRIENDSSMKLHHMEEEMLFLKDQLHYFDLYRIENISEIQKLEKARQVESEQLKILQKRIANLSVDKVKSSFMPHVSSCSDSCHCVSFLASCL